MKSNYVARAIKFMEQFIDYTGINPFTAHHAEVDRAVFSYNNRYHRKVNFKSGSVRFALITSDYVVKWDFEGGKSDRYGGCVEEYQGWKKVAGTRFAHLFAQITPIVVNGMTFYVMPRIPNVGYCHDHHLDYYLTEEEVYYLEDNFCDFHDENWGVVGGRAIIIDYAFGSP